MTIKNLGTQTDLIFARFDGEVLDRGDYTAIRTPSNPTFYWGNFLFFADPPAPGDLARWEDLFLQEIGPANHRTFGWDSLHGETGDIQPFLDAGFRIERNEVLVSKNPTPPPYPNQDIKIRPLRSDAEWEQSIENQVLGRAPFYDEAGYWPFVRRQAARRRRMADAGMGEWFGAFLDGRVVADLGLYCEGKLARYQSVSTHPDFRRRGICGTLVHAAAQEFIQTRGIETFVMLADPTDVAIRIYRSVGFEQVETQVGIEKERG